MISLFRNFLLPRRPSNRRIVIVVDNASWHKKAVKLILSGDDTYSDFDARVEFLFLPPYSPDLNPIEGVWRIARREQTYNHFFRKLDDLRYNLTSYFARFTAPNAKLA